MAELAVQTHDFKNAKNQLKEFSRKTPQDIELQSVATNGGLFNWFDHNVTGDELNNLTGQIQKHLIALNKRHIEFIKEFGQVYNALEALDKDYIQAIILSVKAAEKASDQAKETASKAERNSFDITKTIEVQARTISALQQFKEQLDKYEQLDNVDEMWSDCQTLKKEINSLDVKIENQKKEIASETKEQMNYLHNLRVQDTIEYDNQSKILVKKLKVAYILAGSSIGVTLLDFMLHILRII